MLKHLMQLDTSGRNILRFSSLGEQLLETLQEDWLVKLHLFEFFFSYPYISRSIKIFLIIIYFY